jgi:hypothetical protein
VLPTDDDDEDESYPSELVDSSSDEEDGRRDERRDDDDGDDDSDSDETVFYPPGDENSAGEDLRERMVDVGGFFDAQGASALLPTSKFRSDLRRVRVARKQSFFRENQFVFVNRLLHFQF